jgi:hypothetical protein
MKFKFFVLMVSILLLLNACGGGHKWTRYDEAVNLYEGPELPFEQIGVYFGYSNNIYSNCNFVESINNNKIPKFWKKINDETCIIDLRSDYFEKHLIPGEYTFNFVIGQEGKVMTETSGRIITTYERPGSRISYSVTSNIKPNKCYTPNYIERDEPFTYFVPGNPRFYKKHQGSLIVEIEELSLEECASILEEKAKSGKYERDMKKLLESARWKPYWPFSIANAGLDQSVPTGSMVALNGLDSNIIGTGLATFSWEISNKPAGSKAVLSGSLTSSPTFIADLPGVYLIKLVVNDRSKTTEDSAIITAVEK